MKVKEESEKVGLKLNIQKTKIMASGPITSWQIDGETVETVADFIFWGSKITADGDCSHENNQPTAGGVWTRTSRGKLAPGKNAKFKLIFFFLIRISLNPFVTPWTIAYQAPPSMGFPGKSTGMGCRCLLRIDS